VIAGGAGLGALIKGGGGRQRELRACQDP